MSPREWWPSECMLCLKLTSKDNVHDGTIRCPVSLRSLGSHLLIHALYFLLLLLRLKVFPNISHKSLERTQDRTYNHCKGCEADTPAEC